MRYIHNILTTILLMVCLGVNALAGDTYTFTGAVDNNWGTAGNWLKNGEATWDIPSAWKYPYGVRVGDDVIIPDGKNVICTGDISAENLTIEGNASITSTNGVSVTEGITAKGNLQAGQLTAKTIAIGASASVTCSGTLSASEQLTVNGTLNETGTALTAPIITIGNGASVICSGELSASEQLTVNGTLEATGNLMTATKLTIGNGGLVTSSGDLTVSGQLNVNGTLNVTGTKELNGPSDATVGATGSIEANKITVNTLTIDAGGRVESRSTLNSGNGSGNGSVTVNGTLVVAETITAGPIDVDNGGTITANQMFVGESGSKSLNINNGTVTVLGQNLPSWAPTAINCTPLNIKANGHLKVNHGDVNVGYQAGAFALEGELEIADGKFYLKTYDITVGENTKLDVDINKITVGAWNGSEETKAFLVFLEESGLVKTVVENTWKGKQIGWNPDTFSTDWFDAGNWSVGRIPGQNHVVVIDGTSAVAPIIDNTEKVAMANDIYISGGKKLVVTAGSALYAGRVIVSDGSAEGTLEINHNYNNTASVRLKNGDGAYVGILTKDGEGKIVNPSLTAYNKVKVNETYATGATYYIGSATQEGTWSGWTNLNDDTQTQYDDLYQYAGGNYTRVGSLSGYATGSIYLDGSGDRTISEVGTLRNSETAKSYSVGSGWELLANPYQYSFPLDAPGALTHENISSVLIRHKEADGYKTYVYGFEAGVTLPRESEWLTSGQYLAPQQGFFVKATGGSGTFVFNPSAVKVGNQTMRGTSLKTLRVANDVMYLSINSDSNYGSEDQAAIVMREGGDTERVSADADKKLESAYNNQIYVRKGAENMAIAVYPEAGEMREERIGLGIVLANGATRGTLKLLNADEFDTEMGIMLYDNETGTYQNLKENDTYEFGSSRAGQMINDRFAIVLRQEETVTEVENAKAAGIEVKAAGDGMVEIWSANEGIVNVYDIAGHLTKRETVGEGKTRVDAGGKRGIVIVEVIAGGEKKNFKLTVK